MFTRDQLDHLCMLIALDLRDEEKDRLLPELDTIVDFVSTLNDYTLPKTSDEDDQPNGCVHELPPLEDRTDEFLRNIRHDIDNRMPILQAGLHRG